MDYEKKYRETLERGYIAYKDEDKHLKATLERIFPELCMSEDEKIRKAIVEFFELQDDNTTYSFVPKKDILAWLEKQGTSYTKKDVDDAYLKGISDTKNEIEKQYEANYQIRKDIATFIFNYRGVLKDRAKWMDYLGIKVSFTTEQDKQKSTDKVEPKFHVGDTMRTLQEANDGYTSGMPVVVSIDKEYYHCTNELIAIKDQDNYEFPPINRNQEPEPKFHVGDWIANDYCVGKVIALTDDAYLLDTGQGIPFSYEHNAHLWTIQDAKDGDLIYVSTEEKGIQAIFHEYKNDTIFFHCYLCADFVQGGYMPIGSVELVYPLQKTHYNRFFEKMHEAGYGWDAEKKELKKIENEHENYKQQLMSVMTDSVKDYINQKPINWCEEDDRIYYSLLADIRTRQDNSTNTLEAYYNEQIKWLKSLKERIGG